jgi:hypothetical protein
MILGWCRLAKLAVKRLKSGQESWLVFCASTKCLSLVDTETVAGEERPVLVVRHCVLWPTLEGCDQRCVK